MSVDAVAPTAANKSAPIGLRVRVGAFGLDLGLVLRSRIEFRVRSELGLGTEADVRVEGGQMSDICVCPDLANGCN